jgi:hypothetical protein
MKFRIDMEHSIVHKLADTSTEMVQNFEVSLPEFNVYREFLCIVWNLKPCHCVRNSATGP